LDLLFMPMSVFFPAMMHGDFHWKNPVEEHQWKSTKTPMGGAQWETPMEEYPWKGIKTSVGVAQ